MEVENRLRHCLSVCFFCVSYCVSVSTSLLVCLTQTHLKRVRVAFYVDVFIEEFYAYGVEALVVKRVANVSVHERAFADAAVAQ